MNIIVVMGISQSLPKISFEDIEYAIKNPDKFIIINTYPLPTNDTMIFSTIPPNKEEEVINSLLTSGRKNVGIIIYGRNSNDETIYKKHTDLVKLGFTNVYLYPGGIFEWLLLQDIYGETEFKTTKKELDILKFKPNKIIGIPLLTYN